MAKISHQVGVLNWAYFPRSAKPIPLALQVVTVFQNVHTSINSISSTLISNDVLKQVGPGLKAIGFTVEGGKASIDKVHVPVLYGNNGTIKKAFEADAHHVEAGFVVEIEAGRATINNQFLKDLFQACMMDRVEYLAIAVRNVYAVANAKTYDFERVVTFFETLFASNRMRLPLSGILIVGY